MVTSLSHVLLEKLLSSLLDPKFPLQSVARNSPLAQFLGHPVLSRFSISAFTDLYKQSKAGSGFAKKPLKIHPPVVVPYVQHLLLLLLEVYRWHPFLGGLLLLSS
jgi:hypothetical protein